MSHYHSGTRNQTAWIPADLAAMEAAPSVVLEVAVFNESETKLLNEGSEWLHLPDVQVGPLMSRVGTEHDIGASSSDTALVVSEDSYQCSA